MITSAPISTMPPSLEMNCCGGTLKAEARGGGKLSSEKQTCENVFLQLKFSYNTNQSSMCQNFEPIFLLVREDLQNKHLVCVDGGWWYWCRWIIDEWCKCIFDVRDQNYLKRKWELVIDTRILGPPSLSDIAVFPLQQWEVIMREREGGKYNLRKGRAADKCKYKL